MSKKLEGKIALGTFSGDSATKAVVRCFARTGAPELKDRHNR